MTFSPVMTALAVGGNDSLVGALAHPHTGIGAPPYAWHLVPPALKTQPCSEVSEQTVSTQLVTLSTSRHVTFNSQTPCLFPGSVLSFCCAPLCGGVVRRA